MSRIRIVFNFFFNITLIFKKIKKINLEGNPKHQKNTLKFVIQVELDILDTSNPIPSVRL